MHRTSYCSFKFMEAEFAQVGLGKILLYHPIMVPK